MTKSATNTFRVLPGRRRRRFIVLGTGTQSARIQEAWYQSTPAELELAGFISTCPDSRMLPVLGPSSQLLELIRATGATDLVLALDDPPTGKCAFEILQAMQSRVRLVPAKSLHEALTKRSAATQVQEVWESVSGASLKGKRLFLFVKRLFDLTVGIAGLPVVAAVFIAAALAAKASGSGSIFELEERIGQYGRRIKLMKFRTKGQMTEGCNSVQDEKKGSWIDRFERALCRFRLDKIPAVLNLLKGDLSLIGPYPESAEGLRLMGCENPSYHVRLLLRPGLTGWAQVQCQEDIRCIADSSRRLEYDIYYLKHASFRLDFAIALKTAQIALNLKPNA